MSIEAMKQMVELYDKHSYNNDHGGIEFSKKRGYKFIEAIESLRTAIQQAESEPCKSFTELRDRRREGVDAELAAMAAEAKTDEPVAWGWAIVDNKGLERRTRARIQDFFGSNQEAKPFSLEDVAREDREFAGCAPHRVITLFTHPAPGVPDALPEFADDDAGRKAFILGWNACRDAMLTATQAQHGSTKD